MKRTRLCLGDGSCIPLRRTPKYEAILPQIVEMAEAGSGIDLISRPLGIGAEVVRDALHLHRTGEGFDRLAREIKVSRGTVVRAYDFADLHEAAAAAHDRKRQNTP